MAPSFVEDHLRLRLRLRQLLQATLAPMGLNRI